MCSTQPFNPIMSLTYVTRSHSIHYNVAYDALSPIKKWGIKKWQERLSPLLEQNPIPIPLPWLILLQSYILCQVVAIDYTYASFPFFKLVKSD